MLLQGVVLAQFCAVAQMYEETGALEYSQSGVALMRLLDNSTTVVTGYIASQTPTAAGTPATSYISQYSTKPASLDRATSASGTHLTTQGFLVLDE